MQLQTLKHNSSSARGALRTLLNSELYGPQTQKNLLFCEKERGEFQATLQDYTESIDAIGRALKALKEEDKKTSFVQLTAAKSLKLMPSDAVDSIDAYLNANKPDKPSLIMEGSAAAKPEPKTYEFQSGAAITMLETLADKFVEERNKLEQEEQAGLSGACRRVRRTF